MNGIKTSFCILIFAIANMGLGERRRFGSADRNLLSGSSWVNWSACCSRKNTVFSTDVLVRPEESEYETFHAKKQGDLNGDTELPDNHWECKIITFCIVVSSSMTIHDIPGKMKMFSFQFKSLNFTQQLWRRLPKRSMLMWAVLTREAVALHKVRKEQRIWGNLPIFTILYIRWDAK